MWKLVATGLAAATFAGGASAAAGGDRVSDAQVFDACMVRAEALEYPEGFGPEIMAPNCECVSRTTDDPSVRRNLVETAQVPELDIRAQLTTPETSLAIAACFETSTY